MGLDPCLREKLLEAVELRTNDCLKFLRELVSIPSISGSKEEGYAQKLVLNKLKDIGGLDIDCWEPSMEEIEKYPLYPIRLSEWSYKGRPNVVAFKKGSGEDGNSLVLNGHIDTVSAEPISGWTHDPWGAEMIDGKLFGRGSMDMKAGIASIIYALVSISDVGVELKGDLVFESVVEEEFGGGGTIAAVVRGYRGDAAIIAEPTGSDAICAASGGSRFFKVRIIGKPEWPHLAHEGVNAIALAAKIYQSLIDLDQKRYLRLRGRHLLLETLRSGEMRGLGRPNNMTIGTLRAGDWPATVAGWAEIQGRVGFPPSESGEQVQSEIEHAVIETARADPWMKDHVPTIEWWGARRESYELNSQEPIIQNVKSNIESIVGKCEIYGNSSASDGSYLTPKVGAYGGIPTIWYGPTGRGAHGFDEFVFVEDIVKVTKVLALSITDYCELA